MFLNHNEIDKELWNARVKEMSKAKVYLYSWYLDVVCPGWCAVVKKDYSYFMVIPSSKKFGIKYSMQPIFMQQGGIFSTQPIDTNTAVQLIDYIPKQYRYIVLNFNIFTEYSLKSFDSSGITMHLDLSDEYTEIFKNYSSNTKRNIKKSHKANLSFTDDIQPDMFIHFLDKSDFLKKSNLKIIYLKRLYELIIACKENNHGNLYAVKGEDGEINAAAFFAWSHNQIINIVNMSSSQGYNNNAMFYLFDSYFKSKSGSNLIFDFEGSLNPGVKRFYGGFGASKMTFPIMKINRLPFFLRIFKS